MEDLELMPRPLRDKLDRVGIKLHLAQWQALSLPRRRELVALPCESPEEIRRYDEHLTALLLREQGCPPDRIAVSSGGRPVKGK